VPLAWRRQIVFEPPGVAMLLKLVNDVVSNAKPLCFVEFIPQAANQFARAP
jgi:hypothetical protein